MTLDDFFTLTEMNNGLAAPSRVRELVAVMEKERNCTVKNAADSTRQWSAVASTIVATENKECLDLFLQLDGLGFISKWLKDAQKLDDDTSGSFVEESISHLLRALEKLDIDHEKLLASGILDTVQNLLTHKNSSVQDKAQALFESWKTKTDSSTSVSDVDKTGASTVDEARKSDGIERVVGHPESPLRDASVCQENPVNTTDHEILMDNPVVSTSPNDLTSEKVESANNSDKSLNLPAGDEGSSDHVNNASLQTSSVEPPPCRPDNTTCEPHVAAAPGHDAADTQRELNDSESSIYTKQPVKGESFSDKVGLLETSRGRSLSSSSLVKEMKTVAGSPRKNSTTGEKKSFSEGFSCIDSTEMDSNANGVKKEGDGPNQYIPSRAFIVKAGGNSNHHMLPRSSNSEKNWGNSKDLATFLSGTENKGKVNTPGLPVREKDSRANNYTFSRNLMDRGPDRAGKKSDVEIDYGIVDPLEYAMQVAMEVEREAEDDRERSCGSSGKLLEGHTRQPRSPESVSQKQSHSSKGSPKEGVNEPNVSDESSQSATSSGHQDADQTNGTQDMATSQVTEVAQEEANQEKGHCKFDLNEEVCSEDPDRTESQLFAPVSVVSASRAAAAPGQPGAPLQFEGNLGWKGSAVTSAFRPASPRRMKESDKEPSTGGSSSSSKQRQGFLDFDLNVTESVDLKAGDWTADKHVQLYSTVASGESSAETSSRRSEHLALDLNHSSEDGAPLLDWRIGQFFPQRQQQMSSKQPTRNIDLNDQPNFLNESSVTTYLSPASQTFSVSGGIKSDDSVISIMGKRVEVNRKDIVSQIPPLANGRAPELHHFDVNMGRTGNLLGIGSAPSYSNTPGYSYNNFPPGPPMHFPSTIYGSGGPVPYMVDSRGQPVFPQIVGSASALPTAFSQPPFLVNLNTSTPSNGVGPSRSSFDLNSGMLMESGSKDPAGFGLFLNSAQVRSVEEQSRPNSQPTMNSVFSGKRKEPENGWEHYPFRHCTPPWKQS